MPYFPLLLAWRYLYGSRQEKSIATMVKICFLGISVATFCLTLVATIMRGFEKETYQTIQGCQASLTLQSRGNQLAIEPIEKVFATEFPDLCYSPFDIQYIMIQDRKENIRNVVMLKGIDPVKEAQTTSLEKKIIETAQQPHTLVQALSNNAVLIGDQLAQMLRVTIGDEFHIYYVPEQETDSQTIKLEKATMMVGGIFKTGIQELDANLIICSLEHLQEIFPHSGITAISIGHPYSRDQKILKEQLKKRFKMNVYSWQDRYPALVAALTLETYASFIILTLIVLIASMTILSLLFMFITQKKTDIAVLQAMGASRSMLQTIFIIMGMIIASIAAVGGLLAAAVIGLIMKKYISIELPDAYYVTHLPIALEPQIFVLVFCIVMVISFFATWLPTRSINTCAIADVLRFEA